MTRHQKRRRFTQWLRGFVGTAAATDARQNQARRIVVEPLETRQLLAGDAFEAFLGSNQLGLDESLLGDSNSGLVAEGEGDGGLVGEGEDQIDLVALANAITQAGTRFFGAAWCPFCTEQKELFEDGGKFLPFIEVTNPDRTPNSIATSEGITNLSDLGIS